jgi:hypothetical protein
MRWGSSTGRARWEPGQHVASNRCWTSAHMVYGSSHSLNCREGLFTCAESQGATCSLNHSAECLLFACNVPQTTQIACMWAHMQAIDLKDCDVYVYQSDLETDPFGWVGQSRLLAV